MSGFAELLTLLSSLASSSKAKFIDVLLSRWWSYGDSKDNTVGGYRLLSGLKPYDHSLCGQLSGEYHLHTTGREIPLRGWYWLGMGTGANISWSYGDKDPTFAIVPPPGYKCFVAAQSPQVLARCAADSMTRQTKGRFPLATPSAPHLLLTACCRAIADCRKRWLPCVKTVPLNHYR